MPFVFHICHNQKIGIGTGFPRSQDPDGPSFLFLKEPGHLLRAISGFEVRFLLGSRFLLQKALPGWKVKTVRLRNRTMSGLFSLMKIHTILSQRYRI